jgi:hypothetical protein
MQHEGWILLFFLPSMSTLAKNLLVVRALPVHTVPLLKRTDTAPLAILVHCLSCKDSRQGTALTAMCIVAFTVALAAKKFQQWCFGAGI